MLTAAMSPTAWCDCSRAVKGAVDAATGRGCCAVQSHSGVTHWQCDCSCWCQQQQRLSSAVRLQLLVSAERRLQLLAGVNSSIEPKSSSEHDSAVQLQLVVSAAGQLQLLASVAVCSAAQYHRQLQRRQLLAPEVLLQLLQLLACVGVELLQLIMLGAGATAPTVPVATLAVVISSTV